MSDRSARSAATRSKLLDAAETLIARHGPDAVHLRDVGRLAGQRNNSVVQYHFGTYDAVLSGLLDRALVDGVTVGAALHGELLASLLTSSHRGLVWAHPVVVDAYGPNAWASMAGQAWMGDLVRRAFLFIPATEVPDAEAVSDAEAVPDGR